MTKDSLAQYFKGAAAKVLSAVEVSKAASNQHEFGTTLKLRAFLGAEARRFHARLLYLDDEPERFRQEEATLSYYDSRKGKRQTRTPEWRLYYPENAVSGAAQAGDVLIVALQPDQTLLVIVARSGATITSQLLWLFDLPELGPKYKVTKEEDLKQIKIGFARRTILDALDIEVKEDDDSDLERLIDQFGNAFPTTEKFSEFARSTVRNVDVQADVDNAFFSWVDREDKLFRLFERHLVSTRLKQGFGKDPVNEFIEFSLSVHGRRKSRAGHCLEHHLASVFDNLQIHFRRGGKTEGKSTPDFLFPGETAYKSSAYPAKFLTMLASKSTCKDRWRQICAEADRIKQKHLLTIEPGISEAQTEEMKSRRVRLILPKALHTTFTVRQQAWLLTLEDFVQTVRKRQEAASTSGVLVIDQIKALKERSARRAKPMKSRAARVPRRPREN